VNEDLLRDPLERLVPVSREVNEWADVVVLANGGEHPLRRLRFGRQKHLVAALGVAVAVLGVASALAAAGIGPFASFRGWLTSEPGRPAPNIVKKQVLRSDFSWDAFPRSTNLRTLIVMNAGRARYVLYGFRSGSQLCLALETSSGRDRGISPSCAAISSLKRQRQPIVPIRGDGFLGGSLNLAPEVSFGIVADAVRRVQIHAVDGTHQARVGGDAYLWVETTPNTGNRVLSITAMTGKRRATITLPTATFGLSQVRQQPALGPSRVQATIAHPTIGWLEHREPVGLPPSAVKIRGVMRPLIAQSGFTRFIKPDPLSDVMVGVSKKRLFLAGGLWGGSNPPYFNKGPLHVFYPPRYSSQRFVTFNGVVADGVSRVRVFLADGATQAAALKDNVFTALVPIAPPFRIVAYNHSGRVVASQTFDQRAQTAVPRNAQRRLRRVITVRGPNHSTATLSLGRTVGSLRCYGIPCSIRCWRITFSNSAVQRGCLERLAPRRVRYVRRPGLFADPYVVQPVGRNLFVIVQASANVTGVGMRFGNGDTIYSHTFHGFAIFAIPKRHLSRGVQRARLIPYGRNGKSSRHRRSVYFHSNR
jgi:hypothetical protein